MNPTSTGESVVVETRAGAVRGFWRDGSAAFLAIPFAEPPVGALRFESPVPRRPWSGTRDALKYAATPQRKPMAAVTTIPEPSIPGDDILALNVFTPSPSGDLEPLPVLVYIHGGGYIAGSPASPWYDGFAFNRDGVVTVTVSYRLGFEGFGWLPDAPSNRGILDCLLAMEWVRDNIAGFGGDPGRITIAGQSAGGGLVMTLLTMPVAQGLFSGAASISGVPADIPLETAQKTTFQLAERLGVSSDRAGFASVTERDLVEAQGGDFEPVTELTGDDMVALMGAMTMPLRFGPVIDGDLIQATVEEGLSASSGHTVPLLVGSARGEFSVVAHANSHLFEGRNVAVWLHQMGLDPAKARRFAETLPGRSTAEVLGQCLTDLVFRRRVVDWLDLRGSAPTWAYEFVWPSEVTGVADHCLDVPFIFDLLADPNVARVAGPNPPQALADQVHRAYVDFVVTGALGWPTHHPSKSVMEFDADSTLTTGGYVSARALQGPPGR